MKLKSFVNFCQGHIETVQFCQILFHREILCSTVAIMNLKMVLFWNISSRCKEARHRYANFGNVEAMKR